MTDTESGLNRSLRSAGRLCAHLMVAGACFCAFGAGASGQGPGAQTPPAPPPGAKSGNPTPGTPQPEPPHLEDRVTLTGCLQISESSASSRGRGSANLNEPGDSKFVLVRAVRKNLVPPGTGTSAAAAEPAVATYRLRAIDSQLSPLVGSGVEISGEVLPSTPKGDASGAPTLLVEFVQRLTQKCS